MLIDESSLSQAIAAGCNGGRAESLLGTRWSDSGNDQESQAFRNVHAGLHYNYEHKNNAFD